MTLRIWPDPDFVSGDTGYWAWLKEFAKDFLTHRDSDHPHTVGDLDDVDLTGTGAPAAGSFLGFDAVSSKWRAKAIDIASGFIPASEKGAPDGVATLDSSGFLEQSPAESETGPSLQIRENGGTAAVARRFLNIIGARDVVDRPDTDTTDVDVSFADVRIKFPSSSLDITGLTTPITVPGLTLDVKAGEVWKWELELVILSTATAKAKAVWSGPGVSGRFWGAGGDQSAATVGSQFDLVKIRSPYIDGSAANPNGNQTFNGYTSSGTPTKQVIEGRGTIKPTADGTFAIKAGVVASDGALASSVVPYETTLWLTRIV